MLERSKALKDTRKEPSYLLRALGTGYVKYLAAYISLVSDEAWVSCGGVRNRLEVKSGPKSFSKAIGFVLFFFP